jgi:hypothetical protein
MRGVGYVKQTIKLERPNQQLPELKSHKMVTQVRFNIKISIFLIFSIRVHRKAADLKVKIVYIGFM